LESNGHGLGLAFIDAVARAHGGTASARNRRSGGARIEVLLPHAARELAKSPMAARQGAA